MGWGIDQQITNINLLKVGIFASYVGNSAGLYQGGEAAFRGRRENLSMMFLMN
jgi:hypothetical protein